MAQDADGPAVSRVADRGAAAPGVAGPAGPADADQVPDRRWLILGVVCLGLHSYVVAFWVSAGIFASAAAVCGLVLRPGVLTRKVADVTQAAATVPA